MDPCRGGIACEICLGWVLLLFVDTAAKPRYPLALRPGPATDHRHCGPALRRPPHRSLRHPPHRSLRHPPHGWGLVSCWRAPTLPHVRYKILPAQLLGGDNGTKLSLHIEKAPNRAISGEQGEFSTGSGAVRLVLGEFCTAHAVRGGCAGRVLYRSGAAWFLLGEICFAVAPSVCAVAGLPTPTGAPAWPSAPAARSTLVAVGVLRHAKPSGGVSPACRTLAWRNSPRLVAARSWFAVVWRSNRRPPLEGSGFFGPFVLRGLF